MKKLILFIALFGIILNSTAQDKKISELPTASKTVGDSSLYIIVQSSTTKKQYFVDLEKTIWDSLYIKVNNPGSWERSFFWGGGDDDLNGCVGSIGIGALSLASATSANACTVVGHLAGELLTTGDNNTLLGAGAGLVLTTAAGCIHIGYLAGSQSTTSNFLYIENSNSETPLIGGNFATNRVGINLANASLAHTLDVGGIINSTGGINVDATARIDGDGFFKPAISSDAAAPANSIYYSTTQSKLVYKDAGNGINVLY